MYEMLNVLYVQTQGAVLNLEHDTVKVRLGKEPKLRVPLLRLSGIVVFGRVTLTPFLIQRCAEDRRALVWMSKYGRFKGRLESGTQGNVLLRRAQHLALSEPEKPIDIARQIVAGKIQNTRNQVLRSIRDAKDQGIESSLSDTAQKLAEGLGRLKDAADLDSIRGYEGEAARAYFSSFDQMIRGDRAVFRFDGRSRCPPRDPTNAVLSFLYSLLCAECVAAVESVGLDSQVGYLHTLRPGRPALALDLMEEIRAPLADRLALTLINRKQLNGSHFEEIPGGGIYLTEKGRRKLLAAYEERKQDTVEHRVLKQSIPFGLVVHVQARLLARYLRGDMESYIPFIYR